MQETLETPEEVETQLKFNRFKSSVRNEFIITRNISNETFHEIILELVNQCWNFDCVDIDVVLGEIMSKTTKIGNTHKILSIQDKIKYPIMIMK